MRMLHKNSTKGPVQKKGSLIVCLSLLLVALLPANCATAPQFSISSPNTQKILTQMVEHAPQLQELDDGSFHYDKDKDFADESDSEEEPVHFGPKITAKGGRTLYVPNFAKCKCMSSHKPGECTVLRNGEASQAPNDLIPTHTRHASEPEPSEKEEIYFKMTELLRRIEMGHEVTEKDLPTELQSEFQHAIDDGSLHSLLSSASPWWELYPFNNNTVRASQRDFERGGDKGGAIPRRDFESTKLLTYNGGRGDGYFWAQDEQECLLSFLVNESTVAKDVKVDVQEKRITVYIRGEKVIDKELAYYVRVNEDDIEGAWELKQYRQHRLLKVTLGKSTKGVIFNSTREPVWWVSALKGEDSIDSTTIDRSVHSLMDVKHAEQHTGLAPPLPEEGIARFSSLTSVAPSPLLQHHLLDLLFCYACVYRVFNGQTTHNLLSVSRLFTKLSSVLKMRAGQGSRGPQSTSDALMQCMSAADASLGFLSKELESFKKQVLRDVEALVSNKQAVLHALTAVQNIFSAATQKCDEAISLRDGGCVGKERGAGRADVSGKEQNQEDSTAEQQDNDDDQYALEKSVIHGSGNEKLGDDGSDADEDANFEGFVLARTGLPQDAGLGGKMAWAEQDITQLHLSEKKVEFFRSWYDSIDGSIQKSIKESAHGFVEKHVGNQPSTQRDPPFSERVSSARKSGESVLNIRDMGESTSGKSPMKSEIGLKQNKLGIRGNGKAGGGRVLDAKSRFRALSPEAESESDKQSTWLGESFRRKTKDRDDEEAEDIQQEQDEENEEETDNAEEHKEPEPSLKRKQVVDEEGEEEEMDSRESRILRTLAEQGRLRISNNGDVYAIAESEDEEDGGIFGDPVLDMTQRMAHLERKLKS